MIELVHTLVVSNNALLKSIAFIALLKYISLVYNFCSWLNYLYIYLTRVRIKIHNTVYI